MSESEKVIIGIILTVMLGLIVWLLQSNFNDLKAGIKEIRDGMVGKILCFERHKSLEEKLDAHEKSIRNLYRITNGEPSAAPNDEREGED